MGRDIHDAFIKVHFPWMCFSLLLVVLKATDKQNALRRECTLKIEIVLEIWVAGVNIYFKITVLTLSDVLARLAQSVRPCRMVTYFYQ